MYGRQAEQPSTQFILRINNVANLLQTGYQTPVRAIKEIDYFDLSLWQYIAPTSLSANSDAW
jgi:hypothetical protein